MDFPLRDSLGIESGIAIAIGSLRSSRSVN
jgi:hypothetical protein